MSKILRLPEVMAMTGLSRSSIYLFMSLGTFPLSTQIGVRAVGWYEDEVVQFVESGRATRGAKK